MNNLSKDEILSLITLLNIEIDAILNFTYELPIGMDVQPYEKEAANYERIRNKLQFLLGEK